MVSGVNTGIQKPDWPHCMGLAAPARMAGMKEASSPASNFRSIVQRLWRRVDRHLLLVLLLALIASWAFWARSSLPRQTDAELHVFRAVELGYLLRSGEWFPRWAPDFYYGYGYPIFSFYAPLSYYLANLFSLARPGAAVFGVEAVFVLGAVAAGLGCYLMLRDMHSRWAGVVAAAIYLFAPYTFLIDPHRRGALAETLALCLLPLAIWAGRAAASRPGRWPWLAAVLTTLALLLSHNLIGPLGLTMTVLLTLWEAVGGRLVRGEKLDIVLLGRLVAVPLTAALLSAWFWWPVIAESGTVQLGNLVGPGHFDFRNHFVSFQELFSPSIPLDRGAVNPTLVLNLGLASWLLALIGLLYVASQWKAQPALFAFSVPWLLGGLALIVLITPASLLVWETLRPMAFIQFPWRLLGPASLCLAMLGGLSVGWLEILPDRLRAPALVILAVIPVLLALPIWDPATAGQFGSADRASLVEFELDGIALGTTSTGDYLPLTVGALPGPDSVLTVTIASDQSPDRLNRASLPAGANASVLDLDPLDWRWRIESSQAATIEIRSFYWDGWRARVNGLDTPLRPSGESGFLALDIPAGESEVRVWLGSTPPRRTSIALTGLGLLAVLVIPGFMAVPAETLVALPAQPEPPLWPLVAVGLIAVVTLASGGSLQPYSRGYQAELAQVQIQQRFEGSVMLLGYDLPARPAHPADTITIRFYWQALGEVAANYQVFVHLLDQSGAIVTQSDKLHPGDFPTTRWPLDRLVTDPHLLILPPDLPAGEYHVLVGLYDRGTGIRNMLLNSDGQSLWTDALMLSETIEIRH